MHFRDYNDYEIINLIKQGNEEALALMMEKYKFLIAKKIGKFNLTKEYDDCFQEGLLVMYKSILRFDESFNKSFTRYFEKNLENHYISIIRKNRNYGKFLSNKLPVLFEYVVDDSRRDYFSEADIIDAVSQLSELEKHIFEVRYLQNKSPSETADIIGCDIKKVYNAMDRIRHKLKMHLEL